MDNWIGVAEDHSVDFVVFIMVRKNLHECLSGLIYPLSVVTGQFTSMICIDAFERDFIIGNLIL